MSKISELYKKKLDDKNFIETLSAFDIWTYPKLKIIIKHNQEEIEILENYIKKFNKNDPSEILNKFFENYLITDNENDYILKTSLYEDLKNYLFNNKLNPISKIIFYNFMSSKGFFEVRKEKNKKTLRIYERIKKKI